MSIRRIAKLHKTSTTTVQRKLHFLALQARKSQETWLSKQTKPFDFIQFDDLETFEHSKCKPLTVCLAVEKETRKIIDFGVGQIAAKGHLTKIALKKYGYRKSTAKKIRRDLFKRLSSKVSEEAEFFSDSAPGYPDLVKEFFPNAHHHHRFKGARGAITGQGELKKIKRDPLFAINHTFAMLRANINRLIRKTWCTTKKKKFLEDHIALYVDFHNQVLTPCR